MVVKLLVLFEIILINWLLCDTFIELLKPLVMVLSPIEYGKDGLFAVFVLIVAKVCNGMESS